MWQDEVSEEGCTERPSLFSNEVVVVLLRWCWPSQRHTT